MEKDVEDIARGRLKRAVEEREQRYQMAAEYLELRNNIERLMDRSEDEGKGFRAMMNVGCDCFVEAAVDDASFVFVDVGFGFYPQLTLREALRFIETKQARLTEETELLTQEIARIRGSLRLLESSSPSAQ